MRLFLIGLAFFITTLDETAAQSNTLEQKADTNFAVIVSRDLEKSDLTITQSGRVNGITSLQTAKDNRISTSQSGWQNTVVIYQEGWIDISSVVQSGPAKKTSNSGSLPTSYRGQKTDDGYLSYFTSGGFSMLSLTDSGNTAVSRFGRVR
jgi:hypothetical protein